MKNKLTAKEKSDKLLLTIEPVLFVFSLALLVISIAAAIFLNMSPFLTTLTVVTGVLCFLAGILLCLRTEQIAGYYECPRCEARYVPSFVKVCLSVNFGRTRRMKCQHCGRIAWHEKVLKEDKQK